MFCEWTCISHEMCILMIACGSFNKYLALRSKQDFFKKPQTLKLISRRQKSCFWELFKYRAFHFDWNCSIEPSSSIFILFSCYLWSLPINQVLWLGRKVGKSCMQPHKNMQQQNYYYFSALQVHWPDGPAHIWNFICGGVFEILLKKRNNSCKSISMLKNQIRTTK